MAHLGAGATAARGYLSTSTWALIHRLDQSRALLVQAAGEGDRLAMTEQLDQIVLSLAAWAGLVAESVVRGPAWRFLDLGRRLERAVTVSNLVEAMATAEVDEAVVQPVNETLLAACESLVVYRRRYRSDVDPAMVARLLLADRSNPRSVGFQLERAIEDLLALPPRPPTAALVGQARGALERIGDGRSGAVRAPLLAARGAALAIAEGVVAEWFVHVGEAREVRGQRGRRP